MYDNGMFQVHRVNVPVISVGNMVAGGTGKTPMAEYLIRHFIACGKKVAVLSRGYRRKSTGTIAVGAGERERGNAELLGDEPYQLARKFPDVTVIVDAKRTRSATLAIEQYGAEVIILDDGFQHRALGRDLDIVMLDGAEPLPAVPMLPAGLRREPLQSLRRAGVIAIPSIRCTAPVVPALPAWEPMTIETTTVPHKVIRAQTGEPVAWNDLQNKSCLAVSGIAHPERFAATLDEIGLNKIGFLRYPDHHHYTLADLATMNKRMAAGRADCIVTTEKDSVRLLSLAESGTVLPDKLYYITVETQVSRGEAEFRTLLDSLVSMRRK